MCVRSDSGEFFRLIIMESEVIMKGLSLKRAGAVGLMLLSAVFAAAGCGKDGDTAKGGDGKTKVVLNEVAHSIFYAPMYVAIEEGYFEDAGIELTLVTGFGADKTMTAVLTGEADIGFMGCESTVYTYAGGTEDYVVNFAQLTQRAGNFLVSREPIEDFSWKMLVGKNVLGGRAGGMPSHDVTWEHIREIYEWTSRTKPFLQKTKQSRTKLLRKRARQNQTKPLQRKAKPIKAAANLRRADAGYRGGRDRHTLLPVHPLP